MKKTLLVIPVLGCFVAVAAFLAFGHTEKASADLLLDENIEALTHEENEPTAFRLYPCYHTSGTQCVASSNTEREACYRLTYCK